MREYRTWREFLKEELANPEAAIDYLQVSLEEYQVAGDTSFFLQEVQTVIEAQGGVEEIAKRTAMAPETLSKSFQATRHLILTPLLLFSMRLDAGSQLNR